MNLTSPTVQRWIEEGLADPEGFWERAAQQVPWFRTWDRVFESDHPSFRWFVGARTNLAYNAVDRHVAAGAGGRAALMYLNERGGRSVLTYAQLRHEVARTAAALRHLGVGRPVKGWPHPFAEIAEQGELADHEDAPAHFAQATIHATLLILEDSQADHFANQPLEVLLVILAAHSQENKQPLVNRSGDFALDPNGRSAYALGHDSHQSKNGEALPARDSDEKLPGRNQPSSAVRSNTSAWAWEANGVVR